MNYKGIEIPWYADEWADEYLEINNTEKSIMLIEKCFELLVKKLEINSKVIFIKFYF